MSGLASRKGFRPDLQALRAIAVVLVLLFHVWPSAVPGGYVGVDVFFVVSGFLITGLLVKELESSGRVDFGRFYARRARRLLPASLLTLALVIPAAYVLLPSTRIESLLWEVVASALYVENWLLVSRSVDYLAADTSPSPVQHFWSLSVEEQFYLVWPLLLVMAYRLGRRASARTRLAGVIATSVVASLGYSIYCFWTGDVGAYFSTFTRVWQLACGGGLALVAHRLEARSPLALWVGMALILIAAFWFSKSTPYPGVAALLPTLGTVLFVYGGRAFAASTVTRWMGARCVQRVGDASYSLYLVHWPLVVFSGASDGSAGPLHGALVVTASLVLAFASKRWIEDAFRGGGRQRSGRGIQGIPSIALATLVLCAVSVMLVGLQRRTGEAPQGEVAGALAMSGAHLVSDSEAFLPRLTMVGRDVGPAYADGCIQDREGTDPVTCSCGPEDASFRIAIVGDSHAVHWLPAFELVAASRSVRVDAYTKTGCSPSGLVPHNRLLDRPYTQCVEWTRNVASRVVDEAYDMVVLAQSPRHLREGSTHEDLAADAEVFAAALAETWSAERIPGRVVILRPTPWQPTLVPECAATGSFPFAECVAPPSQALFDDAMVRFSRVSGHELVDFSDLFCDADACPAVIGNIFVYRDSNHITASYARSLAPFVAERLGLDIAGRPPNEAAGARSLPNRLTPHPAQAWDDRDPVFAQGCFSPLPSDRVESCHFGSEGPGPRIALVGDSMAGNLVPALRGAAGSMGASVSTYLKDSCLFGSVPVYHRRLEDTFAACQRWSSAVAERLLQDPPDILVLVQSPNYRLDARTSVEDSLVKLAGGAESLLDPLARRGVRIVALAHTPWLPWDAPNCVLTTDVPKACSVVQSDASRRGIVDALAERRREWFILDLMPHLCPQGECAAVHGEMLVYRDAMQFTATYAGSLDRWFAEQLTRVLDPPPVTAAQAPAATPR